jgi:hypothetical protein
LFFLSTTVRLTRYREYADIAEFLIKKFNASSEIKVRCDNFDLIRGRGWDHWDLIERLKADKSSYPDLSAYIGDEIKIVITEDQGTFGNVRNVT